jgi:hypothetical protein
MVLCGLEVPLGEYVLHAEADITIRMKPTQEMKFISR